MAEFLRFVEKTKPDLVARVLAAMGMASVDAFAAVLAELLGEREEIGTEEFVKYSSISVQAWSLKNSPAALTEDDLTAIYKASFGKG
jgi:hypothetical protein